MLDRIVVSTWIVSPMHCFYYYYEYASTISLVLPVYDNVPLSLFASYISLSRDKSNIVGHLGFRSPEFFTSS